MLGSVLTKIYSKQNDRFYADTDGYNENIRA